MNVKQNKKYIVEGQLGTQIGLFFTPISLTKVSKADANP
jgi:hypothetical protein